MRTKGTLRPLGVIPSSIVRQPLLPVDGAEQGRIAEALEAAG